MLFNMPLNAICNILPQAQSCMQGEAKDIDRNIIKV